MENLTLESLEEAIELGEELHKNFIGLDLKTAVSRAKEIIKFDRKIEELGEKYIGKGGLLNRRIKITAEFGEKAEKVYINGTIKMFSEIGVKNMKDKIFYDSIVCSDNLIYSNKTRRVVVILDEKRFYPYTVYRGESEETFPFKIKDIEVIR